MDWSENAMVCQQLTPLHYVDDAVLPHVQNVMCRKMLTSPPTTGVDKCFWTFWLVVLFAAYVYSTYMPSQNLHVHSSVRQLFQQCRKCDAAVVMLDKVSAVS